MHNLQNCPVCRMPKPEIFGVPVPGTLAYFDCIPAQVKSRYPGWEYRIAFRHQRAERTRLSFTVVFHSAPEGSPSGSRKEAQ